MNVRDLYPASGANSGYVTGTNTGFDLEGYADASTRSGADTDLTIDSDDEIVFMAGDSGEQKDGWPVPEGVVLGSGVKVNLNDPVTDEDSWVYLYRSQGSLDPSAGEQYVDYDPVLNLPGGSYKTNYDYFFPLNGSPPANGYNPEDSTVTTDAYEFHSSDRWLDDELKITTGGSTGVDILDREKVSTVPYACPRTEDTFTGRAVFASSDNAEGTFIANISGPVRAIRSYMGANSGPYTQREQVFYRTRQEVRIFLRVHAGMPSLMSFVDYSAGAIGMTYRNFLYQPGFAVDGERDFVSLPDLGFPYPRELTGVPVPMSGGVGSGWEQVTGAQGTVNIMTRASTTIPNLTISAYQLDEADTNPNWTIAPEVGRVGEDETYRCTGDSQAIGSSGMSIRAGSTIPNSDPRLGAYGNLSVVREYNYEAPHQGQAEAIQRKAEFDQPVETVSAAFDPPLDPAPTAAPASKGFGSLELSQGASPVQVFTFTNAGTYDRTLGTAQLTGSDGFEKTSDTCSGQTLAPAGTCTIGMRFDPSTAGSFSGSLELAGSVTYPGGSAGSDTVTVPLSGTGLADPAPDVNPPSWDFGELTDGGVSGYKTLTVTNDDSPALTLGNFALTGANTSQFQVLAQGTTGCTSGKVLSLLGTWHLPGQVQADRDRDPQRDSERQERDRHHACERAARRHGHCPDRDRTHRPDGRDRTDRPIRGNRRGGERGRPDQSVPRGRPGRPGRPGKPDQPDLRARRV